MPKTYIDELKERLINSNGDDLFDVMPQKNFMDNDKVLINQNPELYENPKFEKTDLFEVKSSRYWTILVGIVHKSKFKNREEFDDTVLEKQYRGYPIDGKVYFAKMTIRQAFEKFNLSIKMKPGICDEKDENERFNKEMIKIFGEDLDDEIDSISKSKLLTLRNYHFLSDEGSYLFATAERGSFYFFIVYSISYLPE